MVCGSDASNASCDILFLPAALIGRLHANREFLDKNQPAVKEKNDLMPIRLPNMGITAKINYASA
jgi:hypothetical protein